MIVPLGNRPSVARAMPASTVTEHDWGDAVPLRGDAVLHLEPMLHGSGRSPFDQQRTLWAAFVVQAAGLKLYHVGDAGYGDGRYFREAAAKHGGFDLIMLPIGAYEPAAFMADAHMSPAQAVKAVGDARAARALAHHFGAFQLGFESFEAPREDLRAALQAAAMPAEAFAALEPGQSITLRPTTR
jgi:L-ascorbate metabolism protein UlaG (beta-lactamase superfamily)